MKKKLIALTLCSTLIAGCAAQEGNDQLLGAGVGAAAGALAGQLAGGNTKSTLIGAAAGAAIGWAAVKLVQYRSNQVRPAAQDAQIYGVSEIRDNPTVVIRRGTTNPKQARAGEQITVQTDYSLQLPQGMQESKVTESVTLKKDGKELTKLPAKTVTHKAGGILSEAIVNLPQGAEPGTYVIEHKVMVGTSYDTDESVFVVQS
jgi:hypothetical protein